MDPSSAQGPRCPPGSNCRGTDDHCRSSYGEHPETGNWEALTRNSHGLLVSYIRSTSFRFAFGQSVPCYTPIEFLLDSDRLPILFMI